MMREEAAGNLRRLLSKLPEWADAAPSLQIPSRLNIEQCSSGVTARYKAALALRNLSPESIADLTGGLGADCLAFSKICRSVLYNEMNPELASAVEHNFEALGVHNVVVRSCELRRGGVGEVLAGYRPDLIYLDPARRSDAGRKLFRLADCMPDVLPLKDELLDACGDLLLKLSPMADISQLRRELGPEVMEVHCVGAGGECKELLLWLRRGWNGGMRIFVSGELNAASREAPAPGFGAAGEALASGFGAAGEAFAPGSGVSGESLATAQSSCAAGKAFEPVLSFTPQEEAEAPLKLFARLSDLREDMLLFEPSAAVSKSGCFKLLCSRFPLVKLGRSTHLYAAVREEVPEELCRIGKLFRIIRIVEFSGAAAAALGREFPRCEVSARNLPLSSEALRQKMKCSSGGNVHIFAAGVDSAGVEGAPAEGWNGVTGVDFGGREGAAGGSKRLLFVTEPLAK
ncbi:MAG: hypothetical protein Q4B16_07640 [Bacteroidia bacterium]|nr:hypothetical protein [Bacteroidia bacterium]